LMLSRLFPRSSLFVQNFNFFSFFQKPTLCKNVGTKVTRHEDCNTISTIAKQSQCATCGWRVAGSASLRPPVC
jgi:hypothetical protein